jgi:hypothetical protein
MAKDNSKASDKAKPTEAHREEPLRKAAKHNQKPKGRYPKKLLHRSNAVRYLGQGAVTKDQGGMSWLRQSSKGYKLA